MKNTTTKNVATLEIFADFPMLEKVNKLVDDGMTKFDALMQVNNIVKSQAVDAIVTVDGINWSQLIDGVIYEQLDDNNEPTFKTLKVSDLFILKANKNSNKSVIKNDLYTMLECFGANILEAELSSIDDETLAKMVVHTKYVPSLECFTCNTCTSINQLEKQFAEFLVYFLGENAPQAKKTYVKHLKRQYVSANKKGYRNGNALALLQLVINHAYDCKHNIAYEVKSGLASHKAPKNDK